MTDTAQQETTFDSFGLHADILRAISEQGYRVATPIQAQAIPVVMQGRDVMGAAQTGTGKTAGFSLPIIQRLLQFASTSTSPARHPVRALMLTPTRELADQVYDNVAKYAKHTALRSAVVFGGVDMQPQTAELRRGVEILVATPGRLLDHVQQKTVNLSQVQMLVLDEADRMLDMGFLPDLQRILNLLPAQRQTLLFSATFSNDIKKLAASYLRDPITIEVARSNSASANVTQQVFMVPEAHKQAAVVHLLKQRAEQGLPKQCIVFTNSKLGCSRLARQLEREGINASAIHGDKTQSERMQTLEGFKQGTIDALVATDVAARGLDIADMPCVINFDLPYNAEDYVHRIGRTGRAGASGDAMSLCAPGDERLLAEIEKLLKRAVPRVELQGFALNEMRRSERGDRFDRGDHGDRPSRSRSDRADRGESRERESRRYPPSVRMPEDPIFSRPYEEVARPAVAAASVVASNQSTQASVKQPPKRPVAALLGGLASKR
jgi:ATP-dependent RNA helicase RhlE